MGVCVVYIMKTCDRTGQGLWHGGIVSVCDVMCCADAEHTAAGLHGSADHQGRPVSAPTPHSPPRHCHQELPVCTYHTPHSPTALQGGSKIKYPTREYAVSPQPVV